MSNKFFDRIGILAFVSVVLMVGNSHVAAQTWTLTSATQHVLEVAPERRVAEAEVAARQGNLQQAGVWPNPTIELGISNAMGKEDGQGGIDYNQFSISQPIPVSGRLAIQRKQTDASIAQAKADVNQQTLVLEYETARVFHNLQFSLAISNLTEQRLTSANEFQRIGQRREQAGDLSRLERLRLDLIRESAKQQIASAEGKFNESLSDFRTLLAMSEAKPQLQPLTDFPMLPELAKLESQLNIHPALVSAYQEIDIAHHSIAVARANRFVDPELWVAHERDVLDGRRQNVFAFGVAITLPLWDRSKGNIDTAQANKQKAKFEVEALQRQLGNRLRLNHLHLSHLIEQGQEYRNTILEPAEEIFQLSRKGFVAGQIEILNLVDAVDIYFNARTRYLSLLKEAWLEAAALRQTSGFSLLNNKGTDS